MILNQKQGTEATNRRLINKNTFIIGIGKTIDFFSLLSNSDFMSFLVDQTGGKGSIIRKSATRSPLHRCFPRRSQENLGIVRSPRGSTCQSIIRRDLLEGTLR
mmetsp:Transcript_65161/g.74888  ORF Transcript_65161/g.74888 Transcript_65161/m.74888 type:complete len:103 (+) Transcript_65161:275-583(+)